MKRSWRWLTKGEREATIAGFVLFVTGVVGIIVAANDRWLPGIAAGLGAGITLTVCFYGWTRAQEKIEEVLRRHGL